jgi:Astacin (Peptidase family M12A)
MNWFIRIVNFRSAMIARILKIVLLISVVSVECASAQVGVDKKLKINNLLVCSDIKIERDDFCAEENGNTLIEGSVESADVPRVRPKSRSLSRSEGKFVPSSIKPFGSVVFGDSNASYGHKFKTIPFRVLNHTESEKIEIEKALCLWQKTTPVLFRSPSADELRADESPLADPAKQRIVTFDGLQLDCSVTLYANGNNTKVKSGSCFNTSGGYTGLQAITHEIGHVLGLDHEHLHPLVDRYVNFQLSSEKFKLNFTQYGFDSAKGDTRQPANALFPKIYDAASVMHYPTLQTGYFFEGKEFVDRDSPISFKSKSGKPSNDLIEETEKMLKNLKIDVNYVGQGFCVSKGDQAAIRKLYKDKKPDG